MVHLADAKKVLTHFKKTDPKLYKAIVDFKGKFSDGPTSQKELFSSLCRIIAGQQLSGKAADSIWNKFRKTFPNNKPTAKGILKRTDEELRETGFSYAKIRSLKDLSRKISNSQLESLRDEDEEIVREKLQEVIGIGPWTSEMFIMFSLGNEDVFSPGDLGLKKGIQKIYKLKEMPTPLKLEKMSKKWSPYRTYASCAIWNILDNR